MLGFTTITSQQVHAIALSEITAYYDWSTLSITGGTYSYINKDKYTTYAAGYSTPNNAAQYSPTQTAKNWNADSGNTYTSRQTTAGGEGSAYATGTQIYANMWAQDGTLAHGDNPGTGSYGGAAQVSRGTAFTYKGNTGGSLTFSINYYLNQHISVQDTLDIAFASTRFDFYAGTGSYYVSGNKLNTTNYSNVIDYQNWMDGDVDSGTYNEYNDPNPTTGTLSFTISNLTKDNTYYFAADIFSTGYAAAGPTTPIEIPQPAPVPEPCTMALMGAGIAGLGFLRKRSTNS